MSARNNYKREDSLCGQDSRQPTTTTTYTLENIKN